MMRIKLNKYGKTLVDDEDFEWLSSFKWHLSARGYVARTVWVNGKVGTVYMHREIMQTPKGMDTDHKDMNPLNNQRSNLRICTRSENMANARQIRKQIGWSKYRGVSKLNRQNLKKPWLASIRLKGHQMHLGYYATQEEAAEAYNQKALELFGDFATLNVVT